METLIRCRGMRHLTRVSTVCQLQQSSLLRPHPLQFLSQPTYLIQGVDTNSQTEWQTVQIQISWLLRSQLIWIYTVCKGRVNSGWAEPGLRDNSLLSDYLKIYLDDWNVFIIRNGTSHQGTHCLSVAFLIPICNSEGVWLRYDLVFYVSFNFI